MLIDPIAIERTSSAMKTAPIAALTNAPVLLYDGSVAAYHAPQRKVDPRRPWMHRAHEGALLVPCRLELGHGAKPGADARC